MESLNKALLVSCLALSEGSVDTCCWEGDALILVVIYFTSKSSEGHSRDEKSYSFTQYWWFAGQESMFLRRLNHQKSIVLVTKTYV